MALMLRLDYHLAEKRRLQLNIEVFIHLFHLTYPLFLDDTARCYSLLETLGQAPTSTERFPKPYFWSVMVGYFLGLSMTVAVMYWFQHAQVRTRVVNSDARVGAW